MLLCKFDEIPLRLNRGTSDKGSQGAKIQRIVDLPSSCYGQALLEVSFWMVVAVNTVHLSSGLSRISSTLNRHHCQQ
jgi:hypothetical protein